MSSNWTKRKKAFVIFALLGVVIAALLALSYGEWKHNSPEACTIALLKAERWGWLHDGCPQPPVFQMQALPPDTNFTWQATFRIGDRTYHGLFASRYGGTYRKQGLDYTFLITTTGDILAVENSGKVRLLRETDER